MTWVRPSREQGSPEGEGTLWGWRARPIRAPWLGPLCDLLCGWCFWWIGDGPLSPLFHPDPEWHQCNESPENLHNLGNFRYDVFTSISPFSGAYEGLKWKSKSLLFQLPQGKRNVASRCFPINGKKKWRHSQHHVHLPQLSVAKLDQESVLSNQVNRGATFRNDHQPAAIFIRLNEDIFILYRLVWNPEESRKSPFAYLSAFCHSLLFLLATLLTYQHPLAPSYARLTAILRASRLQEAPLLVIRLSFSHMARSTERKREDIVIHRGNQRGIFSVNCLM